MRFGQLNSPEMVNIFSVQVWEACLYGILETLISKLNKITKINYFFTFRPMKLIEKKEDIFALKTTKNMLFMGCRNHNVIPMHI